MQATASQANKMISKSDGSILQEKKQQKIQEQQYFDLGLLEWYNEPLISI